MFLRVLIPVVLLFPVLALVVEATSLRRFRGTPGRELLALLVSVVIYFVAWFTLRSIVESISGSGGIALVLASLLSLFTLYPGLWLGFRLFGVRPGGEASAGAH